MDAVYVHSPESACRLPDFALDFLLSNLQLHRPDTARQGSHAQDTADKKKENLRVVSLEKVLGDLSRSSAAFK